MILENYKNASNFDGENVFMLLLLKLFWKFYFGGYLYIICISIAKN